MLYAHGFAGNALWLTDAALLIATDRFREAADAKEADAPKNWTDLTDAKYKGLMVMPDPSYTAIQLMVVGTLSRRYGWGVYQKLRANENLDGLSDEQLDRVHDYLAREVTAGSVDEYDAARKLNAFLSSQFRYTLSKPETARDPLEEFLFVRRSGNCEYFAAALAVMLRAVDVPSRVVGGFQRGEWNPYGRYFMVRLSDAHAWVEAYFDGPGWVTLDPSPRVSAQAIAPPSPLALYLDAARMRWYRYVVNWSLQDQRLFASTVHRQARHVSVSLAWPGWWRSKPWLLLAGFVVAAGLVVWLARDLRRPRQTARRQESLET